jgi:hypothetical protein
MMGRVVRRIPVRVGRAIRGPAVLSILAREETPMMARAGLAILDREGLGTAVREVLPTTALAVPVIQVREVPATPDQAVGRTARARVDDAWCRLLELH